MHIVARLHLNSSVRELILLNNSAYFNAYKKEDYWCMHLSVRVLARWNVPGGIDRTLHRRGPDGKECIRRASSGSKQQQRQSVPPVTRCAYGLTIIH